MGPLINPINLEGLSDDGRLELRQQVYQDNEKAFFIGLLLLFGPLLFAVHRFYLDDKKYGFLIIGLNVLVLFLSAILKAIIIFKIWAFILFIFELICLKSNVKRANKNLALQLDKEINHGR